MTGSLTAPIARRENRASWESATICLLLLCTGWAPPARAQPVRTPSDAVACALRRAGLQRAPDWVRRAGKSRWVPRLTVGARTINLDLPGLSVRSVELFGWARWPLGAHARVGNLAELITRRRSLAEEAATRARRVARLAAVPPSSPSSSVEDEIDREEAQAELGALVGACR